MKEENAGGDSEQFDLRDLQEQIRQNQDALRELGQRMNEMNQAGRGGGGESKKFEFQTLMESL